MVDFFNNTTSSKNAYFLQILKEFKDQPEFIAKNRHTNNAMNNNKIIIKRKIK